MSMTVEALAQEIRQIDENYGAGDQLAIALLPFIERHIAAGDSSELKRLQGVQTAWSGVVRALDDACPGWFKDNGVSAAGCAADAIRHLAISTPQPPKPADSDLRAAFDDLVCTVDAVANSGDYVLSDQAAYALQGALEDAKRVPEAKPAGDQVDTTCGKSTGTTCLNAYCTACTQMKPAGAVPLPEPDVDGTVRHPEMQICYTAPVHYTKERLIEYGAAREAAGRAAGGVPEGYVLAPIIPTKERIAAGDEIIASDGARVHAESIYDAMVNGYPTARHPPAEGVGATAMAQRFLCWRLPATFAPDAGISFDRNYCDKWATWPTGTNLFTADEAANMMRFVLEKSPAGAPSAQQPLDDSANNAGVATGSRNESPSESVTRRSPQVTTEPASAPQQMTTQGESEGLSTSTVEAVASAMTRMGVAVPEGKDQQRVHAESMVIELCHAIISRPAEPAGREEAAADEDGHCVVCGLAMPDERETLEPHECPPGFQRNTHPSPVADAEALASEVGERADFQDGSHEWTFQSDTLAEFARRLTGADHDETK